MAKTTIVLVNDDIDGVEADETLSFAFDGTRYEIDLSSKNADKMRKVMAPYVQAARKSTVAESRSGDSRARRNRSGIDASEVRAWAASNNVEVNSRGRIRSAVLDQYRAAGH